MTLRDAEREDAAAIHVIFAEAQPLPAAVWRDEPAPLEEIEGWLDGPDAKRAILVAEDADGAVVGFAALGPFKTGPGWRVSGEISVYVAAAAQGGGIGSALCRAICAKAEALGLATVIAAVDSANPASIALHERCGFTRIGEIERAGAKSGALRDVLLLQRLLESSSAPETMK